MGLGSGPFLWESGGNESEKAAVAVWTCVLCTSAKKGPAGCCGWGQL